MQKGKTTFIQLIQGKKMLLDCQRNNAIQGITQWFKLSMY